MKKVLVNTLYFRLLWLQHLTFKCPWNMNCRELEGHWPLYETRKDRSYKNKRKRKDEVFIPPVPFMIWTELNWKKKFIKETILIGRMKLDLNRNEEKYLSAIYDLIWYKFECERKRRGEISKPTFLLKYTKDSSLVFFCFLNEIVVQG